MTDPSPLARRMISALRHIGRGNGIEANDVMLISEQSGRYKLSGLLGVTLEAETKKRQEPGRPAGAHVFANAAELEAEIKRARVELAMGPQAQAALQKHILAHKDAGFGAAHKTIKVPGLTYDFALVVPCATCHGKGRGGCPVCQGRGRVLCPQCRGQKEEWCGQCRGTGFQNGQHSGPHCTYCHGLGRTRCLRCNGAGDTTCTPCNGTGHAHCKTCRGAGVMADVTHLEFLWRAQFVAKHDDAPAAVSHLMAKAPLAKLVELGHLAPKKISGPDVVPDKEATLTYHLECDVPWCEATIKVSDGPAFVATSAGLKGRVNLCPNILDKRLDGAKRLEQESLNEVLKRGQRGADRALAKLYPIGLSEKARRHVIKGAAATIRQKTLALHIASWAAGVLGAAGAAYLLGGWAGSAMGFAAGFVLFQAFALTGKYLFARQAGLAYTPRPRVGWEIAAILAAAVAPYLIAIVL